MLAYNLGYLLVTLFLPIAGLTLLIIGLIQRTRPSRPPNPYPGYPPPWPHSPHAGQWAPPPKRRGTGLIVTGAVVLVLGLAAVGVRDVGSSSNDSPSRPGRSDAAGRVAVGDYVTADDIATRSPRPVDCDDPTAMMEVVYKGGGHADCPDGKAGNETDYTTLVWDDATLCFAANFREGQCYSVNTADTSDAPFRRRACDSPDADVKVVQRFDGTADKGRCPSRSNPIAYVELARVFCLEPA